ncbi:MAG TPA: hypothetical protein K8U95_04460, partial [Pseudomonas nitrititolerans]|nr:hypothetical protein [Stutzerimonas nitrititolerans]
AGRRAADRHQEDARAEDHPGQGVEAGIKQLEAGSWKLEAISSGLIPKYGQVLSAFTSSF